MRPNSMTYAWKNLSDEFLTWRYRAADTFIKHRRGWMKVIIYGFIACLLAALTQHPTDPDVTSIQLIVSIFGVITFIIIPIMVACCEFLHVDASTFIHYHLIRLAKGLAALTGVLFMIGQFGDMMKKMILESPNEVAVIVLSAIVLISIGRFSSTTKSTEAGFNVVFESINEFRPMQSKLSSRDLDYIAAHEAGHVLVYAALGCLPKDFEVMIDSGEELEGSFGYVTAIQCEDRLIKKDYIQWQMLVLQAGQFGEAYTFDENSLGCEEDYERWTDLAHIYLSNQSEGIYYRNPKNVYEYTANEDRLVTLQDSQKQQLNTLFTRNEASYCAIRDTLIKNKRMGCAELTPYLSQVVLPEDFPLPLGTFTAFSRKWPKASGLS